MPSTSVVGRGAVEKYGLVLTGRVMDTVLYGDVFDVIGIEAVEAGDVEAEL